MSLDVEALYAELAPSLRAFFARHLFPRDRLFADDFANDVFVRLLGHDYDARYPHALVWTVARNLLSDHHGSLRQRRSHCPLDPAQHDRADPSAAADFERVHDDDILAALDVTPEQRCALHERYWRGGSWVEIAADFGTTESAMKKLHWRALERIRRQMETAA